MTREGDRLYTYSIPELPLALDVSVLVHHSRPASYILCLYGRGEGGEGGRERGREEGGSRVTDDTTNDL